MKNTSFLFIALTAFSVSLNAEPCAAEVNAFKLIESPHKTIAPGQKTTLDSSNLESRMKALRKDYCVAVPAGTWSDPAWRSVAEKLVALRMKKGESAVVFSDADSLEKALQERDARMLAIVAKPDEIDPAFVDKIHQLTRRIDNDPFGDCIWGIITGNTPAAAENLFMFRGNAAGGKLRIDNYLASTNFRSPRAGKFSCITDFAPMTFRDGENGKWIDGKIPASDGGSQKRFVKKWTEMLPELIVSSSHATQYNLEMPWGKGAIVAADGKFWSLGEHEFRQYISVMRRMNSDAAAFRKYNETAKFTQVPFPHEDKKCVWLAAGNCLFGDVNKSPNSMAVTALSHYNAMQVIGYTVPSWYGQGGWGTLGEFYFSPAGTSLSEAWYLNNQFILDRLMLERKDSMDFSGCRYDLNVVALYGDPAFHAYIGEETAFAPWKVKEEGAGKNNVGKIRVVAQGDRKGPFSYWFSQRIYFKRIWLKIGGNDIPLTMENAFFSDDFIWIRELELKDGESAEIVFE